jgi:hypothetical protein
VPEHHLRFFNTTLTNRSGTPRRRESDRDFGTHIVTIAALSF